MSVRKPSTERQRRLGAELRRMREHAGLSLTKAAALHRVDKTTISNTESARFGVSADRVRVWAANYSCSDQAYVDALAEMARDRGRRWWDEYRGTLPDGLLDLAEMEHHAVAMRAARFMYLPGLLQHRDYARVVFQEAIPPMTSDDLELTLAFRLRRRDILDRPEPPQCIFFIHEAALRMRFGSRETIRSQLEELLEQSSRENVTIQVMPFSTVGFPSTGNSALYACGVVPQLDTVQVDVPGSLAFLHGGTQLANYRAVMDRMRDRTLTPERSRKFIGEVVKEL